MTASSNDRRRGSQPIKKSAAATSWQADQVVALLRETGRPMNSTEVGASLPYMWANECREQQGETCWHGSKLGLPLAGTVAHVVIRGHCPGYYATTVLNRLLAAGTVSREKVGRRVMWSLSEDYLADTREVTTLAAVALRGADLAAPALDAIQKARSLDGTLDVAFMGAEAVQGAIATLVASLIARGLEVEWTADAHAAECDEKPWTAAVNYRDNGPLKIITVSVWEGATLVRQLRALRTASRHAEREETRRKFPEGFVIR